MPALYIACWELLQLLDAVSAAMLWRAMLGFASTNWLVFDDCASSRPPYQKSELLKISPVCITRCITGSKKIDVRPCIKKRGPRASKNVWYVLLVVLLVQVWQKNRLLVRLVEDIAYSKDTHHGPERRLKSCACRTLTTPWLVALLRQ